MRKWLLAFVNFMLVCGAISPFAMTASAAPTVLTFDELPINSTGPTSMVIPNGYGGFNWDNFYAQNGDYAPLYGSGFKLARWSAPNTAFNGSFNPATISRSTPFDFLEASFGASYAQTTEPYPVQVDGYQGGWLKYSRIVGTSNQYPMWNYMNYMQVDRVTFTSLVNPADGRKSHLVLDNFTFNLSSNVTPTVPPSNTPQLTNTPTNTSIPINTTVPTNTPVPTNTSVPSNTNTATRTPSPTATSTAAPAQSMHVGELASTSEADDETWKAEVTITVHTGAHAPLTGVKVDGVWSNGATGSASCTTNSSGKCTIFKENLSALIPEVTFTVTNLTKTGWTYISGGNHDPNGSATVEVISRPHDF